MRWFRRKPDTSGADPIDAVLGDELTDGDFTDVAAIAHELRSAYLPTEAPARSDALAAFSSVEEHEQLPLAAGNQTTRAESARPLVATAAAGSERRPPMIKTIAAFGATITGKVVLGTAVAAAAVGGAAATDNLPDVTGQDNGQEQVEAGSQADDHRNDDGQGQDDDAGAESNGNGEGPDEGAFGNSAEGDVPDNVQSYLAELETWVRCVQDNAAAQGDDETRTTEGFDPRDGCDDRPDPADHGLSDDEAEAAEDAQDNANGNAEDGRDNAEDGRANADNGEANADNGRDGASTADEGSNNADEGTSTAGEHDDEGDDASGDSSDASGESSHGLDTADENDDAGDENAEAGETNQP